MAHKFEIRPGLVMDVPDALWKVARNVLVAHSDQYLAFVFFDWAGDQPVPIVAVNLDGQTAKKVADDLEQLRKSPTAPKWLRTKGH